VNAPSAPPLTRALLADRHVFDASGARVPLDSNISAEESALLHSAVRELRPAASVEIGLAKGVSTLAILEALRENGCGHHHVIDPFQANYGDAGLETVRRHGLEPWWTFHRDLPEKVIPDLPQLQFAFIDSSHLFDLTVCEFVLVDRRLEVGGVIGFHDLWMPAQQAFLRYVLANRAYAVWQPAAWPAPAPPRQATGSRLRRALSRFARARRWLAPEWLRPWCEFGIGNLALLRKVAEDTRDWRFHARF
jgi:predicted O-methyltransferase YrrM